MKDNKSNELAKKVIKCAKDVHENLGNGFNKINYKNALEVEFQNNNLKFRKDKKVPLFYKGKPLGIKIFDYCIEDKYSSIRNKIVLKVEIDDKRGEILQSKNDYYNINNNIIAGFVFNFGSKDFEYKIIITPYTEAQTDKPLGYFKKCYLYLSKWDVIIFFFLPVFIFLYLYCKFSILFILLFIPIISFFLSSILSLYIAILANKKCDYIDNPDMFDYCVGAKKEQCICKKKMLIWDYSVRKKFIAKADWIIEKIVLWLVYNFYLRVDFVNVCIKYLNDVIEDRVNTNKIDNRIIIYVLTDLEVFIMIILGIIFYNVIDPGGVWEILVCSFFIWRILTILVIKLNEILSHSIGGKYSSFNRSFIFFITNFIEIIIGYSFLYSSYYFNVFNKQKRNFETIFDTLQIFTDWTIDKKIGSLCLEQQFLVLSQIFVFIILVSVFLTTLPNFNFLRKK